MIKTRIIKHSHILEYNVSKRLVNAAQYCTNTGQLKDKMNEM